MKTVRVAVIGSDGSGKTALLTRYFGYLNQESDSGFCATADASCAEQLKQLLEDMTVRSRFPAPTTASKAVARSYEFQMGYKVREGTIQQAFRLEWIDYPGGWWSKKELTQPGEVEKRKETLKKLCTASVTFLLVDGSRYLAEGEKYLLAAFNEFAQEIITIKAAMEGSSIEGNLDECVIVLTKIDLLLKRNPNYEVQSFLQEISGDDEVAKSVDRLWRVVSPTRARKQYLLLSCAVPEEGKTNENKNESSIRSMQSIGLDLIMPIAFRKAYKQHLESIEGQAQSMPDGSHEERRRTAAGWTAVGAAPVGGGLTGALIAKMGVVALAFGPVGVGIALAAAGGGLWFHFDKKHKEKVKSRQQHLDLVQWFRELSDKLNKQLDIPSSKKLFNKAEG